MLFLGGHHDTASQNECFRVFRAHRGGFWNKNNNDLSFITTSDDLGSRTARKTVFVDCCVMVAPISGIPDSGFGVSSTWNVFGVGIQPKMMGSYSVTIYRRIKQLPIQDKTSNVRNTIVIL